MSTSSGRPSGSRRRIDQQEPQINDLTTASAIEILHGADHINISHVRAASAQLAVTGSHHSHGESDLQGQAECPVLSKQQTLQRRLEADLSPDPKTSSLYSTLPRSLHKRSPSPDKATLQVSCNVPISQQIGHPRPIDDLKLDRRLKTTIQSSGRSVPTQSTLIPASRSDARRSSSSRGRQLGRKSASGHSESSNRSARRNQSSQRPANSSPGERAYQTTSSNKPPSRSPNGVVQTIQLYPVGGHKAARERQCIRESPTTATSPKMDTAGVADPEERLEKAHTRLRGTARHAQSTKVPGPSHIDQAVTFTGQYGFLSTRQTKTAPSKALRQGHEANVPTAHEVPTVHDLGTHSIASSQLDRLEVPSPVQHHITRIHRSGTFEPITKLDTGKGHFNKSAWAEDEAALLPLLAETPSSSPVSPTYLSSETESPGGGYDTPLTSPSSSPVKLYSPAQHFFASKVVPPQVDGGRDATNSEEGNPPHDFQPSSEAESFDTDSQRDIDSRTRAVHHRIDLTEIDIEAQPPIELGVAPEDATPLTRASPAKDATAFPFPAQIESPTRSLLSTQRHPSVLLKFCERNATPRQRQLMASALDSPDRFIPGRTATPDKDAFLLRKQAKRRPEYHQRLRLSNVPSDPFGPSPSRTARMAERFATIRNPGPINRPVGLTATSVPDGTPHRRTVSAGAVWTVGGTVVTEGVASITNGRGGRVTSGTNAPHYTADFLRRQSPSEDEVQHGQRLAVAMEVEPSARMIRQSVPSTPRTNASHQQRSSSNPIPKRTVWNDNGWETSVIATPTKRPEKKSKDIPVIPFRVLDAPALRDDYYCSLLAYSPTTNCLAVGLGPHVYLWSEARGTTPTHIPDSLTAPFGAHVTSVSFSSVEGGKAILAIGRADGRITLWSPQDRDPRFDSEQSAPVSCVAFRPTTVKRPSIREPSMIVSTEELLVGDEAGNVYYYSIEWPSPEDRDLFGWHGSMTLLARFSCHTQQICGIAWSRDGAYFATGGNDNQLLLFETKKLLSKARKNGARQDSTVKVKNGDANGPETVAGQGSVVAITPGSQKHLFILNAAVKAIAFAPWQSSLIAAGGGSNDRCIHFFHALSGATLATIDCHAQVTSLVWSEKRKEIAATFGFAQPEHPYRVAVFSWPSCTRVVSIPWWSEERALYAVAYPGGPSGGPSEDRRPKYDGEGRPWHGRRTRDEGCLVIATSDASIKFHEIWPEKSEQSRRGNTGGLLGGSLILEDGVSAEVEREATIR